MKQASSRSGFTIVEVAVSVVLLVIIAVVAIAYLPSFRTGSDLTTTASQMTTLLREAQNNAVAQKNNVAWGVHFENPTGGHPFYAIFNSSTYSVGVIVSRYNLPSTIGYTTTTLNLGSTTDVIFTVITGSPNASTSVSIYSLASSTQGQVISIATGGTVSSRSGVQ